MPSFGRVLWQNGVAGLDLSEARRLVPQIPEQQPRADLVR